MTPTRDESVDADTVYDLIGIGFGPANAALAIALEERGALDGALFLESGLAPDWQPEMMMEGTDIQHHPLRDLVTPRNPRSPYGFLTYLEAEGRLFDFLNLDAPFPPRTDYARYFRWVARQFDRVVAYGQTVTGLTPVHRPDGPPLVRVATADGRVRLARSISFAPGRSPFIPDGWADHLGDRVVHLTRYLTSVSRWQHEGDVRRIGVVGASQSAVEILLDLPGRFPDASIVSIARGFGFKQKDLSPFTEEIYEPEFIDYYYNASVASQADLREELWRSNYGAADHDIIGQLRFRLYEQKVTGKEQIRLLRNRDLASMTPLDGGGYRVALVDRHNGDETTLTLDAVILATGFRNFGSGKAMEPFHPLLAEIAPLAAFRSDGGIGQTRDYAVPPRDADTAIPPIFLNGVSESSHGFGDAGSFSLLSLRADRIAARVVEAIAEPPAAPEAARADAPDPALV